MSIYDGQRSIFHLLTPFEVIVYTLSEPIFIHSHSFYSKKKRNYSTQVSRRVQTCVMRKYETKQWPAAIFRSGQRTPDPQKPKYLLFSFISRVLMEISQKMKSYYIFNAYK